MNRNDVILIGVFGTLLMKSGLPVWVKYPSLIILTYGGSNLLVSAYRRVKGVVYHPG